jgi:hypothetical protein
VATRSANLGRWFSPDPKLSCGNNPQGLNLYAYVVDNPINLVDPAGLQACDPWDPFCPGFAPSDPCSDPWYAVSHAAGQGDPRHATVIAWGRCRHAGLPSKWTLDYRCE